MLFCGDQRQQPAGKEGRLGAELFVELGSEELVVFVCLPCHLVAFHDVMSCRVMSRSSLVPSLDVP